MIYDKADKVIKELFDSFLKQFQVGLKTLMKGSQFIFDCVYLLCYKCYTVNLNRVGSYIDPPE